MGDKIVKFILNHETTFLKKGYNYPVVDEDEKHYYFNFAGTKMKYAKFYFMIVNEQFKRNIKKAR